MQRWKEEFVGNSQRKCVHVHNNGDFEHGKVLYMEADWTIQDFLNAASTRLNMAPAAKRVFNADGVEIDDCMMIEDDDILFLSHNDNFQAPIDNSLSSGETVSRGDYKIPHIIGGYKVGELLGRGGFGEVRVGEHHLTGERVALKFLRKSEIHSFSAAERTNTEIQCLSALKHNNIIRLLHHSETQNHVVLIFELMDGGDLLKFLNQRRQSSPSGRGRLSEDEARHVFYQVLSAVSYAHNQHICHRDLKLENILLKDSTLNVVKIADFGLSDFYRPGSTVKCNCGTLSFLAPEVFKGTANAGPPLDVWSMGVILFALLCGRLPFDDDVDSRQRPRDAVLKARIVQGQFRIDERVSPEAKDLIRRMLQGDPSERITIPEIFSHVWVRNMSPSHMLNALNTDSGAGDTLKALTPNSLDVLIPLTPTGKRRTIYATLNRVVPPSCVTSPSASAKHLPSLVERGRERDRDEHARDTDSPASLSTRRRGSRGASSSRDRQLSASYAHPPTPQSLPGGNSCFVSESSDALSLTPRRTPTPRQLSEEKDCGGGGGGGESLPLTPRTPRTQQNTPSAAGAVAGVAVAGKSTIKLIPLRRAFSNGSRDGSSAAASSDDDRDPDDFVFQSLSIAAAAANANGEREREGGAASTSSTREKERDRERDKESERESGIASSAYRPSAGSSARKSSLRDRDREKERESAAGDDEMSVVSTASTAVRSRRETVRESPRSHHVMFEAKEKEKEKEREKDRERERESVQPHPPPSGRSRHAYNTTFSPTTGARVRHLG